MQMQISIIFVSCLSLEIPCREKVQQLCTNVLTVVDVLFIIDIHLHQPDQHPRQNTQEMQVCACLTDLIVNKKGCIL